jgi:hypothetical protein
MARWLVAAATMTAGFSADTALAASGPGAAMDTMEIRTLDEVVVTGNLGSLSSLRAALVAAEDRFYARWNALNVDDALDIRCLVEAPTGGRLKRRRCDPQIVDQQTHQAAMNLVFRSADGNDKIRSTDDIRMETAMELKRRTLLLLDQDPELRRALLERARLQQMYDDLHSRKFRGRRFVRN